MFKLEAKNAILTKVNPRMENHGEDFVLAHDLIFSAECDGEVAHVLMGGQRKQKQADWWDGEYKDIKYHGIDGPIKSKAEFEECNVKFKDVTMKEAKTKSYSFVVENGGKIRVKLTAQVYLTDAQITKIERYQKMGGKLTIKTDSVFDPLDGGEQTEIPMDDED